MSDAFRFAERVREEDKYFDVNLFDIELTLANTGSHEWYCEHYINADDPLVLRLNLSTKSRLSTSWSAALKLNRTRIDGIDHEPRFRTAPGHGSALSYGWHRHQWDRIEQSAERCKRPLPGFDDGQLNIRDFVIRVASELRITFNRT